MGFFDELFGDIEIEAAEPTATQLEIERIFLEGLQQAEIETEDFTEFILNSMGLTTKGTGGTAATGGTGGIKTFNVPDTGNVPGTNIPYSEVPKQPGTKKLADGTTITMTEGGTLKWALPSGIGGGLADAFPVEAGTPATPATPGGVLRRLTEEEYIGTLNETGRQNYSNLKAQLERQSRALAGTLPVSEADLQREADFIRPSVEAGSRLGQGISGKTLEGLTGRTTSGIQRAKALQDSILKNRADVALQERQTGQANINQQFGLISNLRQKDVEQFTGFPRRNLLGSDIFAGQSGLLDSQSIFNAQQQAISQTGNRKLLGTILGLF